MRLDQFVADVMEQLRDFVPEGGEVHFECSVYPFLRDGGQAMVYDFHGNGAADTVSFTVVNHRKAKNALAPEPGTCSSLPAAE